MLREKSKSWGPIRLLWRCWSKVEGEEGVINRWGGVIGLGGGGTTRLQWRTDGRTLSEMYSVAVSERIRVMKMKQLGSTYSSALSKSFSLNT